MALQTFINHLNAYKQATEFLDRDNIVEGLGQVIPDGFALVIEGTRPFFNDGSPCVFSVDNCWLVKTTDEGGDDIVLDDDHSSNDLALDMNMELSEGDLEQVGISQATYDALDAACDVARSESLMEAAFGDNFRVAIHPNGHVEEFDHDAGY